jgi:hypothetical protein
MPRSLFVCLFVWEHAVLLFWNVKLNDNLTTVLHSPAELGLAMPHTGGAAASLNFPSAC